MGRIRTALGIGIFALGLLAASAARATYSSGPIVATYAPLPNLAAAGVTFVPLSPHQIGRVEISVSQALVVARHWEPFSVCAGVSGDLRRGNRAQSWTES